MLAKLYFDGEIRIRAPLPTGQEGNGRLRRSGELNAEIQYLQANA
jgi:hypothetical protein